MRATPEEITHRATDIFGGRSEEVIVITGTAGGGYIPFSTDWAAAFGYLTNNFYSDTFTFDESLDIEPTISEDGVYTLDTFVSDIDDLTEEERTQFPKPSMPWHFLLNHGTRR